MNIFFRELKSHYKGLIGWSVGMAFTVASGMAKFSALSTGGQSASQIFQTFPKPVLVILGIQGFDLNTVIGYFGVLFLYIVLVATIHAALLGSEIISKEERDRTSEFLYPKPVSRSRVLTEKLLAGLVNIVVLNLVTVVSSIYMVGVFAKNYSNNQIILVLMLALLLMQLLFFSLGAALAGALKKPKLPAAAATTILLVTYILWVVIDLNSKLENLKYLTPFKYFDASVLISEGHLDSVYVTLSVVLIFAMFLISYLTLNKRDLEV